MRLDKRKIMMQLANRCMKLKALAEASGVTEQTIRRGYKTNVYPDTAGKIAAALGVPVEEIIIEEG